MNYAALATPRTRGAAVMTCACKKPWYTRHNVRVKHAVSATTLAPTEEERLGDLLARMQAGGQADVQDGQQALSELYDASIARVFSLVRRFVGSDAAAEDVTQEVYLQAWQQATRFDAQRGAVMAWLLNLARSRALDAWRKTASGAVIMDGSMADDASATQSSAVQPADFLEATEVRSRLHGAIAELPAATRQMLSLAFFHDMTHQDISAHLHMPLGTVKSTVRRTLMHLREHLAQQGIGADQLDLLSLEDIS
jgi:RNA polymerase sigma factor (sigma-70 family)